MFAVLITGGGVQGISFALDLISVHSKLLLPIKKLEFLPPKKHLHCQAPYSISHRALLQRNYEAISGKHAAIVSSFRSD